MNDWYNVSINDIEKSGAGQVVRHYHSKSRMLQSLYPNHKWNFAKSTMKALPLLISKKIRSTISTPATKKETKPSSQKKQETQQNKVKPILSTSFQTLYLPGAFYMDHSELNEILSGKTRVLLHQVSRIFPKHEIEANKFLRISINEELLIHVYVPSLKLGFRHKVELLPDKIELCSNQGITLIQIPEWWNGKRPALLKAIQMNRPDLLSNQQNDIPEKRKSNVKLFKQITK